jgi:hypothetical protein
MSNSTLTSWLSSIRIEVWTFVVEVITLLAVVLPLFIGLRNRPKLEFLSIQSEPHKEAENKVSYRILLEVKNRGRHPALNCHAHFDLLSRLEADLPSYRTLEWYYPDREQTHARTAQLSYQERASIELLRLVVTETKLSEDQMKYEYELDGKQVASFIGKSPVPVSQIPVSSLKWSKAPDKTVEYRMTQGLSTDSRRLKIIIEMLPVGKFKVSIYGDNGVQKFGQVTVTFGSEPKLDPILDL